jgi:hypothetical protein
MQLADAQGIESIPYQVDLLCNLLMGDGIYTISGRLVMQLAAAQGIKSIHPGLLRLNRGLRSRVHVPLPPIVE